MSVRIVATIGPYSFFSSTEACDEGEHDRRGQCADCDDPGQCASCRREIPAGTPHLICIENGEGIHAGCDPAIAVDRWGPNYW